MSKGVFAAFVCSVLFAVPSACDTGPFPAFLEPLDPLDPVEGAAKSWLLAGESETEVLVLSENGDFLLSRIKRDASVVLEIGTFEIFGIQMQLRSKYRYEFPNETGPVGSRQGAQMEEISTVRSHRVEILEGRLELEGRGTYVAATDVLAALDVTEDVDRGCLLRFVQMSIRTVQARIRNFGGSGTAIYHHNEVDYGGFLEGELSIVLEGSLLSPETLISYASFRDFPELRLDGTFITHVHNTSGDATMGEAIEFQVIRPSPEEGTEVDASGLRGGGGASAELLLVTGSLGYGTPSPIQIEGGDVVGGSYTFNLSEPVEAVDERVWTFLSDLDFRHCVELVSRGRP